MRFRPHTLVLALLLTGCTLLRGDTSDAMTALHGATGADTPREGLADTRRLEVTLAFQIHCPVPVSKIQMIALIPGTRDRRQEAGPVTYTPYPDKIYINEERTYAVWNFVNPPRKLRIKADIPLTIHRYDLHRAMEYDTPETIAISERIIAMGDEPGIEVAHQTIQSVAEVLADGSTATDTARDIVRWIEQIMGGGGFRSSVKGAVAAIRSRSGDCTDYADVFVALCRAKGIPARHVTGYINPHWDVPGHSWAEYYDERYGWVPVDPLYIQSQSAPMERLENKYIYLSCKRNDPELNGGMLYLLRHSGEGEAHVTFFLQTRNIEDLQ